jgi:hypothetical protein
MRERDSIKKQTNKQTNKQTTTLTQVSLPTTSQCGVFVLSAGCCLFVQVGVGFGDWAAGSCRWLPCLPWGWLVCRFARKGGLVFALADDDLPEFWIGLRYNFKIWSPHFPFRFAPCTFGLNSVWKKYQIGR